MHEQHVSLVYILVRTFANETHAVDKNLSEQALVGFFYGRVRDHFSGFSNHWSSLRKAPAK